MAIFNKTFFLLLLACYSFKGLASELKDSGAQKAASTVSEPAKQEKKVCFVFEDGERRLIPSFIYNQMRGIKDLVDLENSGNIYEDQTVIDIPVKNISERALSFIIELINAIENDDKEPEVTDEGIRVYPKKLVNKYFAQLIKSKASDNDADTLNFLYEIYHLVDFLDLRLIDITKGDVEFLGIITEIVADYLLKIDNFVDLETLPFNTNYPFTKELRWLLVPHLKEYSPLLVIQSRDAIIVTRIADGQQMLSVRKGEENGHQEDIYSAQLSYDDSLLVTQSSDALIVTHIANRQQMLSVKPGEENGHQEAIRSVQLSSDNSLLMTQSSDAVIVTRIADGQQICSVKLVKENFHWIAICHAELSVDNSLLIIEDDHGLTVTRLADKEQVFSIRRGEEKDEDKKTLALYYLSLIEKRKYFSERIIESNLSLNQIYQVICAQKQGVLLPYIKNVITPEGNKGFVFRNF